jgi:hypothetical protein
MFRKFEIICPIRINFEIFRAGVLFLTIGLASPHSVFAEDYSSSIQIQPDCSQLEILDAPLPAVAQALSRESGIEIRLPGSLMNEFITTQLSAKDCSSAVLTLLQDFSMMEFWGDDEQLVAVQLLSRKQAWVPEAAPQEVSVSLVSTRAEPEELPIRMAEVLDKDQIQTLIDVGKGKLPPSDVMYNPVYDPYLSKAGLRQPEDWEDKKKVKTLRRHALRAWMQQRKASQSR